MTDTKAIENLNVLISEIPGIKRNSSEHTRWLSNVLRVLDEKFGTDSQYSTTIRAFPWKETASGIYSAYNYQSERERDHQNAFCRQMEQAKGIILSAIDALTEKLEESEIDTVQENKGTMLGAFDPKKVFIVHGHNEEMKQTVARVVTKLGLNPIILHEQANEGRTIIDKFETNAENIQFAIILLSGDDLATSIRNLEGAKDEEIKSKLEKRARQNVVFEMGYFAGKLGRNRLFYLLQDGVAKPGDLDGLVYTPYDTVGAWKFSLVKELKACGYNVDANNVL